jgi:hypothetical protein
MGNENPWLEIDLLGTTSNRDGIGARVILTTGGLSQVRHQGGGLHHHAQDFQRLHFGLGGNTLVDKIMVYWPSGVAQELSDILADQVLQVIEP